jgi:biotin carboxyl carrier protein
VGGRSVGDSYDNALAETINGLYKTEVIRRRGLWRNIEAVEFATLTWVDWFNNHRLFEPIGHLPPAEHGPNYYQQIKGPPRRRDPDKRACGDTEAVQLVPINASVVSVFYRRASPDEPPFVEVGSEVKDDTVVCLLEVMKCYRSVMAGVQGRVEKICVENAQLVEPGAALFLIRPA